MNFAAGPWPWLMLAGNLKQLHGEELRCVCAKGRQGPEANCFSESVAFFFPPGILLHCGLKVISLLARERGWPWSHPCSGVLTWRAWSHDAGTEEEGGTLPLDLLPVQNIIGKGLINPFSGGSFSKAGVSLPPHQIPHRVIISINLALVVHATLFCSCPHWGEAFYVWVSPAAGPEQMETEMGSAHTSHPPCTQWSGAKLCPTTLIYVWHVHVTATQPFSNTTTPRWLAAPRLVFGEGWANFQPRDL